MTMSGFIGEPQGMSSATAITISMFTLVVTILATVLGRGFISIIPILVGDHIGDARALSGVQENEDDETQAGDDQQGDEDDQKRIHVMLFHSK